MRKINQAHKIQMVLKYIFWDTDSNILYFRSSPNCDRKFRSLPLKMSKMDRIRHWQKNRYHRPKYFYFDKLLHFPSQVSFTHFKGGIKIRSPNQVYDKESNPRSKERTLNLNEMRKLAVGPHPEPPFWEREIFPREINKMSLEEHLLFRLRLTTCSNQQWVVVNNLYKCTIPSSKSI